MDPKKLDELRAEHGEVRVIELQGADGAPLHVVLRRPRASLSDPKADEFFAFWTKRTALEQAPDTVKDPGDDGLAECLRGVVHPSALEVKQHLEDFPMDAFVLFAEVNDLAGAGAVSDAPELVTDEVRTRLHRRAFAVRAGAHTFIARPMSRFEFQQLQKRSGGKLVPMRADALAWAAWSCVDELPGADKVKARYEAAVQEVPYLAIYLGMLLVGLAGSQGAERLGKSIRPSSPP